MDNSVEDRSKPRPKKRRGGAKRRKYNVAQQQGSIVTGNANLNGGCSVLAREKSVEDRSKPRPKKRRGGAKRRKYNVAQQQGSIVTGNANLNGGCSVLAREKSSEDSSKPSRSKKRRGGAKRRQNNVTQYHYLHKDMDSGIGLSKEPEGSYVDTSTHYQPESVVVTLENGVSKPSIRPASKDCQRKNDSSFINKFKKLPVLPEQNNLSRHLSKNTGPFGLEDQEMSSLDVTSGDGDPNPPLPRFTPQDLGQKQNSTHIPLYYREDLSVLEPINREDKFECLHPPSFVPLAGGLKPSCTFQNKTDYIPLEKFKQAVELQANPAPPPNFDMIDDFNKRNQIPSSPQDQELDELDAIIEQDASNCCISEDLGPNPISSTGNEKDDIAQVEKQVVPVPQPQHEKPFCPIGNFSNDDHVTLCDREETMVVEPVVDDDIIFDCFIPGLFRSPNLGPPAVVEKSTKASRPSTKNVRGVIHSEIIAIDECEPLPCTTVRERPLKDIRKILEEMNLIAPGGHRRKHKSGINDIFCTSSLDNALQMLYTIYKLGIAKKFIQSKAATTNSVALKTLQEVWLLMDENNDNTAKFLWADVVMKNRKDNIFGTQQDNVYKHVSELLNMEVKSDCNKGCSAELEKINTVNIPNDGIGELLENISNEKDFICLNCNRKMEKAYSFENDEAPPFLIFSFLNNKVNVHEGDILKSKSFDVLGISYDLMGYSLFEEKGKHYITRFVCPDVTYEYDAQCVVDNPSLRKISTENRVYKVDTICLVLSSILHSMSQ